MPTLDKNAAVSVIRHEALDHIASAFRALHLFARHNAVEVLPGQPLSYYKGHSILDGQVASRSPETYSSGFHFSASTQQPTTKGQT
jgi:hypothetical protein